eukprot:365340-Chlamydomonas_euryale.AAC.12
MLHPPPSPLKPSKYTLGPPALIPPHTRAHTSNTQIPPASHLIHPHLPPPLSPSQAPGTASVAAPSPKVHCLRIEDMPTLEPATHAYSFWEGIPEAGRQAMGRLFARSRTMRGIAVVQVWTCAA